MITLLNGQGHIELQDVMGTDADIVSAARTSVLGETKGEEADRKLLFYLMQHGHTSPFEQALLRFRVKAPLFVVRQWMRHRTWAFNEQSRRYSGAPVEFYVPAYWRLQGDDTDKQASGEPMEGATGVTELYEDSMNRALATYTELLVAGVSREMARMVLPVSMMTTFVGTVSLKNLMDFICLRLTPHAQPEIQAYAAAMLSYVEHCFPWTYEAFMQYRYHEDLNKLLIALHALGLVGDSALDKIFE